MADNQNFDSEDGVEVEIHEANKRNKMDHSSNVQMFQHPLIDHKRSRYPYCIVWTPIPLLTWLFPFIGHMGIATSAGIIRDFAGPYYVSEDCMAFGKPTRYLICTPRMEKPGLWDQSIFDASEEYKTRIHNLCCDNCHSHVAMALNDMRYQESKHWNMVKLAAKMFVQGKYVGACGIVKTWLPSLIVYGIIIALVLIF